MVLFVLCKLILQTRMRSHPVGLDVWFLVGPFVYFYTFCVRTAKALSRLRGCAGSPEPSLVAYVISTIISWAGSNGNFPLPNTMRSTVYIQTLVVPINQQSRTLCHSQINLWTSRYLTSEQQNKPANDSHKIASSIKSSATSQKMTVIKQLPQ